jgi:acetylglutamate kinase
MASATAVAMSCLYGTQLIYCFEKKGVLSDPEDDHAVITALTSASYKEYKSSGVINKGMIPKLDNAFTALEQGVSSVIICHADDLARAILKKSGTTIQLH